MKFIRLFLVLVAPILFSSCIAPPDSGPGTDRKAKTIAALKHLRPEDCFDSKLQIDLAKAIEQGNVKQMQLLVNDGADVNCLGRNDMTPLFWALIKEKLSSFVFLLEHSANPNGERAHSPFVSALDLAARMENSEYLEQLLKHGAEPDVTVGNSPQTAHAAMFSAILYENTNNIAILLRHKANVNVMLPDGTTALHYAVYARSYEAALFLYHSGADPFIKNKLGYNAIDTMKQFGPDGIILSADRRAYYLLLQEFKKAGIIESDGAK